MREQYKMKILAVKHWLSCLGVFGLLEPIRRRNRHCLTFLLVYLNIEFDSERGRHVIHYQNVQLSVDVIYTSIYEA